LNAPISENDDGNQIINPAVQSGGAVVAEADNVQTGNGNLVDGDIEHNKDVQFGGANSVLVQGDKNAIADNGAIAFGGLKDTGATNGSIAQGGDGNDNNLIQGNGSIANDNEVEKGGTLAIGTGNIAGNEDSTSISGTTVAVGPVANNNEVEKGGILVNGTGNMSGIEDSLISTAGGVQNYNQDGIQTINPAVADGQIQNNDGDAVGASGGGKAQMAQAAAMDSGKVQNSDGDYGTSAMDSGKAQGGEDNQNAMDSGKNQAGKVNAMDSGTAKNQQGQVNAMDSGTATANNQEGQTNAMYNGMAQSNNKGGVGQMSYNGNNNYIDAEDSDKPAINTGTSGIAAQNKVEEGGQAAIAMGGSAYYIGEEAALVVGAGTAVSDPSGPVAFGGNAVDGPFSGAVSNSGSATYNQATKGGAVNTGNGLALGSVKDSAVNNGAGNAAVNSGALSQSAGDAVLTGNNSAVATHGAIATVLNAPKTLKDTAVNNQNVNVGSGIANQGQMGVATVTGPIVTPTISPPAPGIQTVAVTNLSQVNAGISFGNGNSLYSGGVTMNANSTNSASNGVMATSHSIGVAANSAAQNIVNVSANINYP